MVYLVRHYGSDFKIECGSLWLYIVSGNQQLAIGLRRIFYVEDYIT